jgi:histone deacetylase complex regulatory component SIN3
METEAASFEKMIDFVNKVCMRFRDEEGVCERFFGVMNMFERGKIDIKELGVQVAAIFDGHQDLLDGFTRFTAAAGVEEHEKPIGSKVVYGPFRIVINKKGKGLCRSPCVDTKKPKRPTEVAGENPDLSECPRVTPSYLSLYAADQPSRRTDLLDSPLNNLNDSLVCKNLNVGNYPPRVRKQSEEEKLQEKYEDDRYEMDMFLESVRSTAAAAEKLLNECRASSENPIPIKDHSLSAMNIRCIEKVYGDHGIEIVRLLRENPRDVLPVVVPRLRQKLEEVKEWARLFSFKNYSTKFLGHKF